MRSATSVVFAERPADRCLRRLGVALRQPQQREAGLRLAPLPVSIPIGLLGRAELAPEAMELADHGSGVGDGRGSRRLRRPAGPSRLVERRRASRPQLHDLGAMDRHRPVKATMSGWRSHQRDRAAVHSWARRTS